MSALLAVSGLLLVLAAFGLTAVVFQFVITWRYFLRKPAKPGPTTIGISILKPLCGADDGLAENLRQFATLPYPNYELLLGVKNAQDAAYPLAMDAVRRWPHRVKLFLQRGEPGLNPKVNQLCTLEMEATKEIILVSDSNTRVPDGFLEEIASIFESDPEVACTCNPIVGIGEEKLGSALDHIYLTGVLTAGMVAAKAMGKDIVVGKSMALRRSDLERMGGFHAARNYLAEDYVLGLKISEIGKKVRICRLPVYQVSQKRSYSEFLSRHRRWSIIHRTAIAPTTYFGEGLMNPIPWTLLALLCYPSRPTLLAFVACWAVKAMLDAGALRLHRPAFGLRTPLLVLLKDLSVFSAWCHGVFRRTVVWRGNRLRVEHGSRLCPPAPELAEEPAPELAPRPALAAASWAKPRRDSDRTAA